MPLGWHLTPRERKFHLKSDIMYSHTSSPGTKYPHPFPFSDNAEASLTDNEYGPVLRGVAKRGWLLKSGKLIRPDGFSAYGIFKICVGDGAWAGVLIDDRIDQSFPQSFDEKCEAIAIAEGGAPDMQYRDDFWPESEMLLQTHFPESPVLRPHEYATLGQKGFLNEFYFVLWIGWIDGIAYRRGIGRILKSVWESIELKETRVCLG